MTMTTRLSRTLRRFHRACSAVAKFMSAEASSSAEELLTEEGSPAGDNLIERIGVSNEVPFHWPLLDLLPLPIRGLPLPLLDLSLPFLDLRLPFVLALGGDLDNRRRLG